MNPYRCQSIPGKSGCQLRTYYKKGGTGLPFSLETLSFCLGFLLKNDSKEREQNEGLDQRETEQQHREYSAAGPRISRRSFASGCDCAAVTQRPAERGDSDRKRTQCRKEPRVSAAGSAGARLLRRRRTDDQQRREG